MPTRGTSPAAAAAAIKNQAADKAKAAIAANQDHSSVSPPQNPQVNPAIPSGVSGSTGELAAALALILPSIVRSEIDRALESRVPANQTPLFTEKTPDSVPAEPHQFAATFRCDTMPALRQQKFDFEAAAQAGESHLRHMIPGEFIEFYNGIYQTDDQNEILQLEWSAGRQSNTGGPMGKTVGGNPAIYRVTGQVVLRCPHKGCNFAATSQADVDGHFRATHG